MSFCTHTKTTINQIDQAHFQCRNCGKVLIPASWIESQNSYDTLSCENKDAEAKKDLAKDKDPKDYRLGHATRLTILEAFDDVKAELDSAMARFNAMNSAHEGFAVIQEEFNRELWQHVCTNQKARDLKGMRKEAVQVAAMAIRFVVDVCNEGRGRR